MGAVGFIILGVLLTLTFIIVVPLLVIKSILGGRGQGGGSPRPRGKVRNFLGGFPTSFYTLDRKFTSFKMDPKLFDFSMPKATPELGKLTKKMELDLNLARKLHLGADVSKSKPETVLDMEKARDLFLMGAESMLDFVYPENGDEEEGDIS